MAIRVRVIEKVDDTYVVERQTAEGVDSWTQVNNGAYAASERAQAIERADKVYARLNRPAGDAVIYMVM